MTHVSSLQSDVGPETPQRQSWLTLNWIGQKKYKGERKRKQLGKHKRMELQMGTNLAWVSVMFLYTQTRTCAHTSTTPITVNPSFSLFLYQVILLFVMFRGRHQSRNGRLHCIKGNVVSQKWSFPFQQEIPRLRSNNTSNCPENFPCMKRL